jgi:hypothetical protein
MTAMDDEADELTWASRWRALETALAHQVANEAREELEYQATRAYWVTRGLAERDGVSPEMAHLQGRRAAADVIEQARRIRNR